MQPFEPGSGAAIPPPLADGALPALFHENIAWAESIARTVHRRLPPSFDLSDLQQIALIAHWGRVGSYDPARNNNYRAYAHKTILGAVLMACRRRHFREATHDELNALHVDNHPRPDEALLAREQRRNVDGPREYRRRQKVLAALAVLPPEDADLVRAVLGGADASEFDAPTRKRFTKAVGKLRREIVQAAPSKATPAPDPPPREALLAALPTLPPADAYLVRRVHLDGYGVADLAAVWGVDPSGLETRLAVALRGVNLQERLVA
jgi:DNA-directed RNA polymerase specialized sigma24 family protein